MPLDGGARVTSAADALIDGSHDNFSVDILLLCNALMRGQQ